MYYIKVSYKDGSEKEHGYFDKKSFEVLKMAHDMALKDMSIRTVYVFSRWDRIVGGYTRATGNLTHLFRKA